MDSTYIFFVKTNKNIHKGGFVFYSREEFDGAKDDLVKEVENIIQSEQAKDSSVKLEYWGIMDFATGEVIEKLDSIPNT